MSQECYNMTWTPGFRRIGRAYLGLAIPAFLFHVLFWIQVAVHRPLRQLSMLWVYNYLFTDMLLLLQLFTEHILRTSLPYCISPSILNFFCNIEAYTTVYITVLQAYMLVSLNITRYYFIVKNCNIAARHPHTLVLFNIFLYVFGISLLLFQVKLFRIVTIHVHQHSSSCHFQYHNLKTQIGNLILVFLIPVLSNCYFMTLTTIHVRHSQQAVRAQVKKLTKYFRNKKDLVFDFSIVNIYNCWFNFLFLYILWLILWAPNAIVSHFISNNYPSIYTRFGSITSSLCGPLIFMFIDRRFLKVWKTTIYRMTRCKRPQRQIRPSTISNELRVAAFTK